jgi:hypothetical protein
VTRFLLAALAAALPTFALAVDVVGAEACKACHEQAYEAWKVDPHANAEASLGDKAKEPACLSCHAPQKKAGVAGVSCEGCHGPGQFYAPSYVMRDAELARAVGLVVPGEKECRACHDASSPSLEPFDYAKKLKLVDHWSAERAARKAGKPEAKPAPKAPKAEAPAARPAAASR